MKHGFDKHLKSDFILDSDLRNSSLSIPLFLRTCGIKNPMLIFLTVKKTLYWIKLSKNYLKFLWKSAGTEVNPRQDKHEFWTII